MSHVIRRAGVIYYRAKVPADLRDVVGKREFSYLLRTNDLEVARELSLELCARQLRLCRLLRQSGWMMSKVVIDGLVQRYLEMFAANREEDAISLGQLTPEFTRQRRAGLLEVIRATENDLAENNLASVEYLARDLIDESGLRMEHDSPDFRRLCFRLPVLVAAAEGVESEYARLKRMYADSPLEHMH